MRDFKNEMRGTTQQKADALWVPSHRDVPREAPLGLLRSDERRLALDVRADLGKRERQQARASRPPSERLANLRTQVKRRAPGYQDRYPDLAIHKSLDEEPGVLEVLRLLEEKRDRSAECRFEVREEERRRPAPFPQQRISP
jgi:hypothetical protein